MDGSAAHLGLGLVALGASMLRRSLSRPHRTRVPASCVSVHVETAVASLSLEDADPPRLGTVRRRQGYGRSGPAFPEVGDGLTVIHPKGRPDELEIEPNLMRDMPVSAALLPGGAAVIFRGG